MKVRLIAGMSAAAVGAAAFLGIYEGRENRAYLDPVGVVTICDGWTKGVRLGDIKTDEECAQITQSEVLRIESLIDRHVQPELSAKTMQSLITFTYNVGDGGFLRSSLLKDINRYGALAGCFAMADWHYAGGKNCFERKNQCFGVVDRRAREIALCIEGAL